jgi:hypothetical protein
MQVEATASVGVRRRRVHAQPAPAPDPDRSGTRVLEKASARTYGHFPVEQVGTTPAAQTVNWERAYADAQRMIDAIDFSKGDIVIYVPGTDHHGMDLQFRAAVDDSYKGEGSNAVALEYPASRDVAMSVPTGVATLHLVLEEIRRRGGSHRVLLAGTGQGAWVAGEVLADPAVADVVSRAILLGPPAQARHKYAAGQDARVRVVTHTGDPLADPEHGVSLLGEVLRHIPVLGSILRDPARYDGEMSRAVEYLKHGTLPFSTQFVETMGLDPSLAFVGTR